MTSLVDSYVKDVSCHFFFFFQAEDGIRDVAVTGVQTCALPIFPVPGFRRAPRAKDRRGADRREPYQLPGHPDPGMRDAPAGMVHGPDGPFLRTGGLVDAAHGLDPHPERGR